MHYFSIYASIFSAVAALAFFAKNFSTVKNMSEKEILEKLKKTKSFFYDINFHIVAPAANFFYTTVVPKAYKEFEIAISKIRINVLRLERLLLHLTYCIRGKREVTKNDGNHPYWSVINKAKSEKDDSNTPA